jgi:hypothetical protein
MPRTAATNGLSIDQLENLLNNRRGELQKLQKHRNRLMRQLDQVDNRIRSLGGRGGPGRRARNQHSLTAMMENALKAAGKPLGVGEIAEAVQRKGYHSNSANFRAIVNQSLIKDKRFAQAGRGVYQLKK